MEKNNHVCPWWMAYTFDNPLRKLIHNSANIFSSYLKPGMTALDIGCGMGYFSLGMAGLVGNTGKIVAIDLQQKMLDIVLKRAKRKKVSRIIQTHQCEQKTLNINVQADLILTFWMVHETPDPNHLITEISNNLKPGGYYFNAEPKMHVSRGQFDEESEIAAKIGLKKMIEPPVAFSHAAVFRR